MSTVAPEMALWEQTIGRLSRLSARKSTALAPLISFATIVTSALVAALYFDAPSWLTVTVVVFLALLVLTFLGAYILFSLKNPDALRSERHSIQKMMIERGILGDSSSGLGQITGTQKLIDTPPSGDEGSSGQ